MTDLEDNVTVWVCDTETGEARSSAGHEPPFQFPAFWWAEGNGSCDCNRSILFGRDPEGGFCLGCKRYRIVCVTPMPEGYTLADFNAGYPGDAPARLGQG